MASETCEAWREGTLGDFLELKRGYDLPKRKRNLGQVPIVSSSGHSGWHDEAKVAGPGVVTGRYGTIGEVFFVPSDFWPLNTSLYVRDFRGADPRFVSYFLRTVDWWRYTDKAAVPGVNRNHVHLEPAVFPPVEEQKRIAAVLGSLDDKIELNRKMNQTLEEMAQAIFKSWFIDFDDVPEEDLVDSEFGPIPKGWEVMPIGDVLTFAYGKSLPKRTRNPGTVPVYGSGGLTGEHDEHLVAGPGVIVGRKGTVGSVYWEETSFFPIDTTFYIDLGVRRKEWMYWVYQRLSAMNIAHFQSDSAVPGVNRNTLHAQSWVIPPENVLLEFERVTKPLRAKVAANNSESETLAELRDTLLPRLISGEIRVPETFEAAEAALDEVDQMELSL